MTYRHQRYGFTKQGPVVVYSREPLTEQKAQQVVEESGYRLVRWCTAADHAGWHSVIRLVEDKR
jgi:hypothetical protein